jgi:hypothetical protein
MILQYGEVFSLYAINHPRSTAAAGFAALPRGDLPLCEGATKR